MLFLIGVAIGAGAMWAYYNRETVRELLNRLRK